MSSHAYRMLSKGDRLAPFAQKSAGVGRKILGNGGSKYQSPVSIVGRDGIGLDLDALSKAGQVMDKGGLTRAGRALEKHGGRTGSVFPKAKGNIANKNLQDQFHLDDILTHPKGYSKPNKFGGVDYYGPDGCGGSLLWRWTIPWIVGA